MASVNPIVEALETYVEQNKSELMLKTMFEAETAKHLNLMTGIAGDTTLNLLDVDPTLQDGSDCGWDEDGDVTASQRVLEPQPLKVNMGFCDKKLLNTYAQHQVKVAAGIKNLPFEEELTNGIKEGIGEKIEKMIWQGDGSKDNEFEGYLPILLKAKESVDVSYQGETKYNFIKKVYLAAPSKIKSKSDCAIFVGKDVYDEYVQDLVAANLYHYDPANGKNSYKLPGTNVPVIGVEGLSLNGEEFAINFGGDGEDDNIVGGNYPVIVARTSNLVYGISGNGDDETIEAWYSKDNREFRFAVEFLAGVQVAYPSEVTLGM